MGLRFDPLIRTRGFRQDYRELLDRIFASVDPAHIHSISYGAFRLPRPYFKKMVTLYPDERLFATGLTESNATVSYAEESEQFCLDTMKALLTERVDESVLFPCS